MPTFLKNNWKQWLPVAVILLLVVSLFMSRAALSLLSVTVILFVFFYKSKRRPLKTIAWASLCILLPVLFSGLWSSDKEMWVQSLLVKIPLFTVCAGLLSVHLSKQQLKIITWSLSICVLLGSAWSACQYCMHSEAIIKDYLVAKVMPVPLDDDHIRFSWLVVLNIILLLWQLFLSSTQKEKIIGGTIIFLLAVYLHLLAAKTGLLCLYLAMLVLIFYFIFQKRTQKKTLAITIGLIGGIWLAYLCIPTLHNRMQYAGWNFEQYSSGKFEEGSSDGARLLSLRSGWDILRSHPLAGVGFGDIKNSVNDWYGQFYPQIKKDERFAPINEWLLYGAGSGWPGIIFFTAGLVILSRLLFSKNIFSTCLLLVLLVPLIGESYMEVQFGVVIFSLCFSLGYHLHKQAETL